MKEAYEAPRSLLLTAGVGLAFAIVSICLHDSIATSLAGHKEAGAARHLALVNSLRIVVAWVIALTTSLPRRWAVCILPALFAGWVFSWAWHDWVTDTLSVNWREAQAGHGDGFRHKPVLDRPALARGRSLVQLHRQCAGLWRRRSLRACRILD